MSSRKKTNWSRLDNAAKIFPPTSSKRDTKVFRFACELKEPVEPALLQKALDKTILQFPFYQSVLKHGLFWYYFEQSRIKPVVQQEYKPVCSPLFDKNRKNLLFDVTYYHCRINLEIYHALTDGTGALQFLKSLVCYYLVLRYPQLSEEILAALDYDASNFQRAEDSFQKYYDRSKKSERKRIYAYHIRGNLLPEGRIRVTEGVCPAKQVLGVAHENGATLTVYLCAVLIYAIGECMSVQAKKKPVRVDVPVNLRNFFDSETARNFFGVINVGYHFGEGSGELGDVILRTKQGFEQELTVERLTQRISGYTAIEKNPFTRITPLVIKDIALWGANRMSKKEVTCSVSNIGRITMPQQLEEYINRFDVFVSTDKLQICICSYGDRLSISFTSAFDSTEVQKRFFRILTSAGVDVEIVSNQIDEDEGGKR